jgi:hypothetical protein
MINKAFKLPYYIFVNFEAELGAEEIIITFSEKEL